MAYDDWMFDVNEGDILLLQEHLPILKAAYGLSTQKVAEILEVSFSQVRKYERLKAVMTTPRYVFLRSWLLHHKKSDFQRDALFYCLHREQGVCLVQEKVEEIKAFVSAHPRGGNESYELYGQELAVMWKNRRHK